jgi:MFS family permease
MIWFLVAVQGVGGGAILTLNEIIIADLVPLRQRGVYFAIVQLCVFVILRIVTIWLKETYNRSEGGRLLGPPIGGALASHGAWIWLFCLSILFR